MRGIRLGVALALGAMSGGVQALDWSFEDWGVDVTLNTKITAGAMVRMQDRSFDLIGKQSVPGQRDLCEVHGCISLSNDPQPNLDLVNSKGAYSGVNGDDGDLNYDRHDLVAATIKLIPDLTVKYGEFLARVRAIGFYDPVNVDFDETHFDTRLQPAKTKRPDNIEKLFAKGVNLYEAYLQYAFTLGERQGVISVGNQIVRWGESTLVAINSLAEINPPNAIFLHMPGGEINEIFQPVPVVLISGDVFEGVSAEFVYQFGWKKVQPDPRGTFFSNLDLIDGDVASISLGQFGENPNLLPATRGELAFVSQDAAAIKLMSPNEPRGDGQFGLRVNYFAEWLNGGTEMGFYFLKYHSRYPYATVIAVEESCARDSTDLLSAVTDCEGFNGSLSPLLNPGGILGDGIDPLTIQTMGAYLDYPEDLNMYGFSFNTNLGSFSLAGEFSYRPDMPLQVQLADLIFAGLQPSLPVAPLETPGVIACDVADIGGPVSTLCGLQGIHFPSADEAIPSYYARYNGFVNTDENTRIQPRQKLPGYIYRDVMQADFTVIRAVSNNPLGADQILFINEFGATYVADMPDRRQLQLQGAGSYFTSAALGSDGTGTPDAVSGECSNLIASIPPQESSTCHLTPTTQKNGFADAFSWGIRSFTRFEYNDVVFGWSFKPFVILQWDVNGIGPFPIQNFVQGRKDLLVGTEVTLTEALAGRVQYNWITGGGANNTISDRDNFAISLAYSF